MPYAVVFYLDSQTSEPIQRIIKELAINHAAPYLHESSILPHITLAIYNDLDCRTCEEKIAKLASQMNIFDLNFSYLGVFHSDNPVVFLGPTTTQELISIHQQVHETLQEIGTQTWELYQPGRWVPHCSLAVNFLPEMLEKVITTCMQITLPLTIPIAALGVIQFEPVQPLYHYAILEE